MDIEISGVFDYAPGNCWILAFCRIGKHGNQLANLYYTHAASVLKKMIIFKCRKIMMKTIQVISDTLAIHDDFLKNHSITSFDKAAPHLSRLHPKRRGRIPRW